MNNLVIAVSPDSSLELLGRYADIIVLDKDPPTVLQGPYDTVYIRSHFAQPDTLPQVFRSEIDSLVADAIRLNPNVRFIDSMSTVDEIVSFEDKWHQYELFGEYMPRTYLYDSSANLADIAQPIYKNRLSSHGEGVTWDKAIADGAPAQYIVQESLSITEELRIYGINASVYPIASVRRSKTRDSIGEVVDQRDLTIEETEFAENVISSAPFIDISGLDIARTSDGRLYLLEVNRSPGFGKFYKLTGINLADMLYSRILLT